MNHLIKFSIWIGLFVVTIYSAIGQIQIVGKIKALDSGKPLENVAVQFENDGPKTTTDSKGDFTLRIDKKGQIVIIFPGYKKDTIYVLASGELEIFLKQEIKLSIDLDPQIVISGRAINLKLPAAMMKIHKEHLERDIDVSIAPALNRVTGVNMQSGTFNTNRITIRGIGNRSAFSTTKLRAYLDEIPLTNGEGETTLEDIDLSIVENVDIWKGPTASIYGAGLGGMIHLKTSGDLSTLSSSLKNKFMVGSYGLLRNVMDGEFTNVNKSLHIGVNINTTQSESFRENNEYNRSGMSLLVKFKSGDENETTIFGNLIKLKAYIPSSLNFTDYSNSPQKAALNWAAVKGFEDYSKNLFGIAQTTKIAKIGKYILRNKASLFMNTKDAYESRPFNILEEENRSVGLRSIFELRSDSKERTSFPLFSLGIELFREKYKWKIFQTNQGVAEDLLSDNEEVRRYMNLFSQSYYPVNDKATLFTGVNVNVTKYKYDDIFLTDGMDKSGTYSFASILSPHLGFNYQFDYKIAIFATISHGFSPPTLTETLNPNGTINPEISPERGWNYELGSRGKFASGFTYELTGYTMHITDLLVAQRIAEDQYIGLNAGKTVHNGIELFLEYQAKFSSNFEITPFLTYTFSDYKFKEFIDDANDYSGNALTGTPPHQLNLGIDISSEWGVYGHLNYRYVDAFPMRDDNSIYSESYQISNVMIGFRKKVFSKIQVDLTMGLRNVFDEKYASMILINASSFVGNQPRYYYPGFPRNYFTSLSIQYLFE